MTDPMYLGYASTEPNADLDTLQQLATNTAATATAAAASAATLAALVPSPALGREVATLANYINHSADLWLGDYGVIGDGTTDDTVAVQAALTAGATYNRVVYGGGLICKISGALTMAGPGLVFDTVDYGVTDPGLKVTGSGYTALTVTGVVTQFSVCVWGTGNTANGVLFQNPQRGLFHQLRVYALDGFGAKINKCYDCTFNVISVESCGNATHYAFSVNDDGDTSNMSHFVHIQVEQANRKAIFIDEATLSCVFDSIHSERATPNAADETWVFGGNSCTYNGLRVNSLAPAANATVCFRGTETCYIGALVEGAIDTELEGIGGYSLTFVSPNLQGTTHVVASQIGTITMVGGAVITFATDCEALRVFGTKITTLTLGFATSSDPLKARFHGCNIGTLVSSAATAAGTFTDCVIGAVTSLPGGFTVFRGCDVTATTLTLSTGTLEAHHSIIRGAIVYNNNRPLRLNATRVTGTVTCGDAGTADLLFDAMTVIGAGSSGVGIPTGGAHVVGQRHYNAVPVVGQPKSWVCTVAGTPGTFVSEGNL